MATVRRPWPRSAWHSCPRWCWNWPRRVATALVAVEVGLRLLAGHLGYQTALLVLLLTPEAYLPLRAVGLHFHASMEGAAAAGRVCDIIETAPASPGGAESAYAALPGPARRRPTCSATCGTTKSPWTR